MIFLETDDLELELLEGKMEKELADKQATKEMKAAHRKAVAKNIGEKGVSAIKNVVNGLKRMATNEISEGNIINALSHITGTVAGAATLAVTGQFKAALYFTTIRASAVGKGLNAFAQRKLYNSYQAQYDKLDAKIKELDKEETREAKEQKMNLIECRSAVKTNMNKLSGSLPHFNNKSNNDDD